MGREALMKPLKFRRTFSVPAYVPIRMVGPGNPEYIHITKATLPMLRRALVIMAELGQRRNVRQVRAYIANRVGDS
jgi:hypothetical protein